MTNATNSPAVNDTMEDRAKVIPTTSAVLRPVAVATVAANEYYNNSSNHTYTSKFYVYAPVCIMHVYNSLDDNVVAMVVAS